ncbi:hypothetical protein [Archaeoglobus sp. UBA231]|uniref:hypothetical protein n=1 Tax=Archaeoglobus sp. UBA231 TaxID=1915566 RepID=UPI0025C6FFB2|nr:hypothetical protein [Archaeoglobus sp. UBA231]
MGKAMAVLIVLAVVVTAVYAKTLMENTAVIAVESPYKAKVYTFALYPDGFRQVGKYEVAGEKSLALYLGSAKAAWMKEYSKNGRLSQPLILLVAMSEKGVDVKGVNLDWDDLKGKEVKLEFREDESLKRVISKLSTQFEQPQPLGDLYWAIEDSYEYTLPVVLSYVKPDSSTWGTMDYFYAINKKVGFSVNVFISSWSITEYNIIQKYDSGSAKASFTTGDDYYIWMNVRYRYEKWVYYLDDDPILTMELIFVKDFYPNTITKSTYKPWNAQLPEIDDWDYKGTYTSATYTYPYYELSVSNFGTDHFAIDCMKFIDILKTVGKISSKAVTAATSIGLFTDVDFKYDNVEAFYFGLALYSDPGITHTVRLAESEAATSAPQIYIKS